MSSCSLQNGITITFSSSGNPVEYAQSSKSVVHAINLYFVTFYNTSKFLQVIVLFGVISHSLNWEDYSGFDLAKPTQYSL